MDPTTNHKRVASRPRLALLLAMLVGGAAVWAAGPIEPLPVPEYSFSRESWAVQVWLLDAGDILTLDLPHPTVIVPRYPLGLLDSRDDLDALSAANAAMTRDDEFVLLFSVDAQTVGDLPPDPALVALNVPYNAFDQAAKNQAAGDQFMCAQLFTLQGLVGSGVSNNLLTRNNFDEGGTDFSAQPPTSAEQSGFGQPLDIVNASARLDRAGQVPIDIYYSLTSDSPSLMGVFGHPSGASIYFNENPHAYAPIQTYAGHDELQLLQQDDIDALIVFDTNDNRRFDLADCVLFSLAPESPSLATIPGASDGGAADLFIARPGHAPALFFPAAELGLGEPVDNIDALDFHSCGDALACAALHGIRSPRGDMNCDGLIDLGDVNPFVLALTDPVRYADEHPTCDIAHADINQDGKCDFGDINPFVSLLTPR